MRKLVSLILLVAMLCGMGTAFAAISGDEPLVFQTPVLITNAGQGPGGKMARLLMTQTGTIALDTDFFYKSEPGRDAATGATIDMKTDLASFAPNALICVIGSTDKGLGASGISIDDEVARLEIMIAAAKELNIPVIGVLLEKDKRSDIATNPNERCIDVICKNAAWMIVVKDGNTDGRFDALKAELNIPLTILDTSMDFTMLSKTSFVKEIAAPAA